MRPTDALRTRHDGDWTATTRHAFTDALARGTLPDRVMAAYLVQDYRFLDSFVRLLAQMVAHAPTLADAVPGAQFLGVVTGPENTYFLRSLKALGVVDEGRDLPDTAPTAGFKALMREAAASGRYEQMLAVLVVAEWSYLEWAERVAPLRGDLPFYLSEWIDLHSGPAFAGVVDYLRDQLDRAWEGLDEARRAAVDDTFARAIRLEREFFDAAMAA